MIVGDLNLKSLRALSKRNLKSPPPRSEINETLNFRLSRRQFFKVGAGSGLTVVPSVKTLIGLDGQVDIKCDSDQFVVYRNGLEKFAIRPKNFCGRPRLSVSRSNASVAAILHGARLPGTLLFCDMEFELWKTSLGWRVRVAFPSLNFVSHGYLEDWFGSDPLTGRCSPAGIVLNESHAHLEIASRNAEFRPDWSFTFPSPTAGSLLLEDKTFTFERLVLAPVADRNGGAFLNSAMRRTNIDASRGRQTWTLGPPRTDSGWEIAPEPNFFDYLQVEATESASGRKRVAVVARRRDDRPSPAIVSDLLPSHADLRVTNNRYALAPAENVSSFMADLAPGNVPLQFGSLSLFLTNPENKPAVCINCDGKHTSAMLTPSCAVQASFPGATISSETIPSFASIPMGFRKFLYKSGDVLGLAGKEFLQFWPQGACLKGKFAVAITRPQDFLDVTLEFRNTRVKCDWAGNAHLEPDDPKRAGLMIAHFPPQAIADQAFHSSEQVEDEACKVDLPGSTTKEVSTQRPIEQRLAQPSRVVFRIFEPDGRHQRLPLKLDNLLSWARFPVVTHQIERKEPTEEETCIEMPYGLVLTPLGPERFRTTVKPRKNPSSERYELWSAQLANGPDINDAGQPTVHAIFNRLDYRNDFDKQQDPINGFDDVVKLSATPGPQGEIPVPIEIKHLLLTSRGGTMSGALHTERLDANALTVFEEKIADARETLEKLSFEAYLLPTGHKVLLQSTKKRQWCTDPTEFYAAYEIERIKIVVLTPTIDYTDHSDNKRQPGRQLPFLRATIPIKETPYLSFDDAADYIKNHRPTGPGCHRAAFYWPAIRVNGSDSKYQFPLEFTDIAGKTVTTKMPLMLVMADLTSSFDVIKEVVDRYNNGSTVGVCTLPKTYDSVPLKKMRDARDYSACDFSGEKIAFAPANKNGDTSFNTRQFAFAAVNIGASDPSPNNIVQRYFSARNAPWYPVLNSVLLDIEALRQYSVSAGDAKPLALMRFHKTYLDDGFPGGSGAVNKGEVFLETLEAPRLNFNSGRAGGLATPTSDVCGISRQLGLVPGPIPANGAPPSQALTHVSNGNFQPDVSFSLDESKLLGVIGLGQVLAPITDVIHQIQQVPKLVSQELQDLAGALDQVQNQLSSLRQQMAAIRSLAKTDIDALLDSEDFRTCRELLQISELCVRVLIRGEVNLIPKQIPAYLPLEIQNELKAAQVAAQKGVAEILEESGCGNAATLPQVRDCAIAMVVKQGVDSRAYAALSSYADAAIAELFPLATEFASFLNQFASSPWLDLVRNLVDLEQQISAQQPPLTLISALTKTLDAAGRVPNLSNLSQTINLSIADGKQKVRDAVAPAVTKVQAERDQLTAIVQDAQAKALALSHKQVDLSKAISTIVTITKTTDEYLNSLNQTAADWQKKWDTAWQPVQKFVNEVQAAAAEIQTAVQTIQTILKNLKLPTEKTATYEANPSLQDAPAGSPVFVASKRGTRANMTIRTRITVYLDARQPATDVYAEITNFTINLFPGASFLQVGFDSLSFESKNGQKPIVKAQVAADAITFLGTLNFVQQLQNVIKFPGDNGPTIQLTPSGIFAGIRLSIPPISSGAFVLKNIAFEGGVSLSFTGEPALVRFSFADPNNRFLLAYGIFGGGGYFALESGLGKIKRLQGALEFGAVLDLNLGGVAKGNVHAFGGFFFDSSETATILRGYLRVGGALNILGLVTLSVEFFLGLAYENRGGQAWLVGDCSLTVEIDILFFSSSVNLHMHREFSGSSSGSNNQTGYLYDQPPLLETGQLYAQLESVDISGPLTEPEPVYSAW